MRSVPFTATLAAALLLTASPALQAMGFGRTALATNLGQRLDFTAAITLDADETLARECVGAEVHAGDALLPAPAVRVSLEPAGEGGSGRRVRVTTSTLIDEPVVTIDVSVGCSSRMTRRFVTFIDPPSLRLAEAPAAAPIESPRDSQVAAIVDAARNGSRRPRAASRAEGGGAGDAAEGARTAARRAVPPQRVATTAVPVRARRSADTAAAEKPRRTALARRGSAPGLAAAARGAPRLQLDAPAALAAASAPRAALAAASAPAASASMAAAPTPPPLTPELAVAAAAAAIAPDDAAAAALARERERIQVLEAGLAHLRAESAATQQSLVTLQARLRQAEGDRYANGLVYALAGGMLFFAALAAFFWAIRPRQRRRARWFDASAGQQARAGRKPAPGAAPASMEKDSAALAPQDTPSWTGGQSVLNTAPATIGGLEVTTVLGPEFARAGSAAAAANSAGPTAGARRSDSPSMEALIDLEQQVEFFTVLGQDEAAVSLLDEHLRSPGATSPLPYLGLLELHQRRRDATAFEQVRAAYRERFQAEAPTWRTDLNGGRGVADHPQTLARLQSLWSTPLHAMQSLDALLFRREAADERFEFPAYRDLLFLYAVARELAGNVDTDQGSIDLFLPLGEAAPPAEREAVDTGFFAVDLDVTGWAEEAPAEPLVIRRSPGRHGAG